MARIFNIYFNHNEATHNAVVTVRTTPFFTEYILTNLDEGVMVSLPGNKILSTGPDHFVFQHASQKHSADLMRSIIQAVSEHLQVTHS
jgi:hypothetical protein